MCMHLCVDFKPMAGHATGFLTLLSVHKVSMHACVSVCVSTPRILIISGVIWRDLGFL